MSPLQKWGATVGTVIASQWTLVMLCSSAAWMVRDYSAALSLFIGGASVALPNTLMAGWLTLKVGRGGVAGPAAMLTGEVLKIGMVIASLTVIATHNKTGLSWLALIIGIVVALKAQWIALMLTRRY